MPRYAIFLTPLPGDALTRAAAAWLGRDAFTGEAVVHPVFDRLAPTRIADLTQTARIYGFHGTLKAPFHLVAGATEADLTKAFDSFCDEAPALPFPALSVGSLSGFTALLPERANPEVNALADAAVRRFDELRHPASEAEVARRNPEVLNAAQRQHLRTWGYPFVMDQFSYHMTLSKQLPADEQAALLPILQQWFAPALAAPATAALAIFRQRDAGAPFIVHKWRPIGTHR